MVGRALALSFACLLVISVPALAQDVTGPPVAVPETTFFAHSAGSGATKWMSTIQKDPAGTDTTVTMAFPGSANTGSTASFKFLPAPTGPIVLDKTKDIQFNIRFGSGLAANYGTVSTKLRSGTTEIASAAGAATQTVSSYGDVKLKAKATVDTLAAGQDIVWDITFSGEGSAYIQVSQNDQWCNLVLPILSAPAAGNATNETSGNATKAPTGNTTAPPVNATASTGTTHPAISATNATGTSPAATGTNGTSSKQSPGLPAQVAIPLLGTLAWMALRRRPRQPQPVD